MSHLPLEFYQIFNGFYELYLSNNKTIVVYFDSFTPVEGKDNNISIVEITDLKLFISSQKLEGHKVVDIPLRDIIGNKKLNEF